MSDPVYAVLSRMNFSRHLRVERGGGLAERWHYDKGGWVVLITPKMMTSFMNSPLYCFHCSYCYTVGTTNKKAQKYTDHNSWYQSSLPPTPAVYFFQASVQFWPIMANDGDFVTNLCTFWRKRCAEVPKMTNISFDKHKDKTENKDIRSYLVI